MTNKPILIQVAMEIECQKLLEKLEYKKEKIINGYHFYEGTFMGYPIILSLSKVGLIQASTSLTIALMNETPKLIMNIGIAGATSKELHTKDIVIGTHCININSYRTPILKEGEGSNPNNWELLTFLSGEEDRLIEKSATPTLIELTKKVSNRNNSTIHYGKIGSGDAWNREIDRLLYFNKKYNILCEDMESIATYTLADEWNIPVISIKMISDNALIGEEYDRNVGIELQTYILNYLEILIQNIRK